MPGNRTTIVFKHGRIPGGTELFRDLLASFEAQNPDLQVKDEELPSSSDEQHQFYVINLEAGSPAFDVFALDIIWIPEFVRAGWLRPLRALVPAAEEEEFFPGALFAGKSGQDVYAIPWFMDAGLLYYRKDLLAAYGFPVPQTWEDLVGTAKAVGDKENIYGFVWQGKQYEGLVCNALEFIWSNGGAVLKDGEIVLDSESNRAALTYMHDMIYRYQVTPQFVSTLTEESSRRIFGNGRAVFMRNWPYAWSVFEAEDSKVKGKVGIAPLPAFAGKRSVSALGGWSLAVNRFTKHPGAAERLLRFLVEARSQKQLALAVGYQPTRIALYDDPELLYAWPFLAELRKVFETARPRPVTPFYLMISQVLQPELSSVLVGVKDAEEALNSAAKQIHYVMDN